MNTQIPILRAWSWKQLRGLMSASPRSWRRSDDSLHVTDECQADDLARGQEETRKGAKNIVLVERGDEAGAEDHHGTKELGPEEHGEATPEIEGAASVHSVRKT